MHPKLTWLACTIVLALAAAPASIAQDTRWVVSDEDGGSSYTLFGSDDSAFLGVTMEEETEHREGGARITRVVDESPAAAAGLKVGDVVIGFDEDTIRGPVGLTKKIRQREPGDTVRITVLREGRERTFDVELGQRSDQRLGIAPLVMEQLENLELPDFEFEMEGLAERLEGLKELRGHTLFGDGEWQDRLSELGEGLTLDCKEGDCDLRSYYLFSSRPRLGVQLTETTPELREHLGGSADAGVLISKVIEGSAAADAGIHVGDLIVSVDGDAVSDTSDLRRALAKRVGETFDIEVVRDGRSIDLSVTLEAEEDDRPSGPRARLRMSAPAGVLAPSPPAAPAFAAPLAPAGSAFLPVLAGDDAI